MLIKKPSLLSGSGIASSEITDRQVYKNRRQFMVSAGLGGLAIGSGVYLLGCTDSAAQTGPKLPDVKKSQWTLESLNGDKLNTYKEITSYNNFYELGTAKDDPAANAKSLHPRPWSVQIDGEVQKPQTLDIDRLLKLAPLEERVYRMRCVEAWSMVIPWIGFSFSELAKLVQPKGNAKYVEFTTLLDPKQFPGQERRVLDWPYVEGLRIDEAMHPLCLLGLGLYGEVLPNQNGAPVRIVVPWKYGFKSIKSIVRIRFTEQQPRTAWNVANPSEYGFYSNVNPEVDHPRWTQATERRIGEFKRRRTLPFNGYADQVASLYAGLDLKKFF